MAGWGGDFDPEDWEPEARFGRFFRRLMIAAMIVAALVWAAHKGTVI